MKVTLPYGHGSVRAEIPDRNLVLVAEPKKVSSIQDEREAIKSAIMNPDVGEGLEGVVAPRSKVTVVVSDITRPVPSYKILPPLVRRLNQLGVLDQDITILTATGLHRVHTRDEKIRLVSNDIAKRVQVVDHVAQDKGSMVELGTGPHGTPIIVNKILAEADVKITIGDIEPHGHAGWTGGRKSVLPGVSSEASIAQVHSPAMNDHPNARLDILDGNPVHEDMEAAAKKVCIDFIINTVLTGENEIMKVTTGDLVEAHRIGVNVAREAYRVPIPEKVDILVSSPGGYPKDQILYIALKGFVPPVWVKEPILRHGGTIILLARCEEGLGSAHLAAFKLLMNAKSPSQLIETIYKPGFYMKDQWAAQVFARILEKYELVIVSDGLDAKTVKDLHMTPAKSVEEALELAFKRHGRDARILVTPHGTKILPYLSAF